MSLTLIVIDQRAYDIAVAFSVLATEKRAMCSVIRRRIIGRRIRRAVMLQHRELRQLSRGWTSIISLVV